jgi:predicted transcriptional regulator of viral defense system
VAGLAGRQSGRVRHDQLRAIGVAPSTISDWRRTGYLYPVLPRVYGVGHIASSVEADLTAAVLYAGPGAMLSHATAIWWLGLLKYPPPQIHVSTPRRVRTIANVVVHRERRIERRWRKGLPVTPPSRAILDFAATGRFDLLRLVLANADHEDVLDVTGLQRMMGMGVDGTVALRAALAIHLPELANTRSGNEILLLTFCETQNIPIPEMNVYVGRWLVDAVWRKQRVVVEIDGWRGHRSPAQLYEDHARDLGLRAMSFIVLRYARRQFIDTPADVAHDLTSFL